MAVAFRLADIFAPLIVILIYLDEFGTFIGSAALVQLTGYDVNNNSGAMIFRGIRQSRPAQHIVLACSGDHCTDRE